MGILHDSLFPNLFWKMSVHLKLGAGSANKISYDFTRPH